MSDAPLRRVRAIRLVTQQPEALARFYAETLGATIERAQLFDQEDGAGERTGLTIGAQRIQLDRFATPGAPYPAGVAADDPRFQHVALAVADIAAVYGRVMSSGATAISRGGPVTLPASSGGVTAVKLRDPEGHPFELLRFRAGAQPGWDRVVPNRCGVLGIDHSAITVRNAAASDAFYAGHGLVAAGAGINRGPTQAALDGLDAPVVDVVPLHPAGTGPHLELLGYRGSRRRPAEIGARDVAATRIVWVSDRDGLLVDPDGHRHRLERG